VARSAVVSGIVNWLALTKLAVCAVLLNVTVEELRNPVPLMVSVCAADPTGRELGDRDVIAGTGLPAVTVKLSAAEDPPPGVGLVTTTG
jgi:hypothetical protein